MGVELHSVWKTKFFVSGQGKPGHMQSRKLLLKFSMPRTTPKSTSAACATRPWEELRWAPADDTNAGEQTCLPAKNKQRFHSFGNISGTVRSSGFLSASVKRRLFIHAYLGDFHLLYCSLSTKRKLKSHRNNEWCKVSWMPGEKHAFPNNPHTPRRSLDLWEMSSSSLATGSSSFTGGGTQHSSAFHPGIFFLPLSKQTSSMYQSTSQRSY